MPVSLALTTLKGAGSILGGLLLADFITGVFHWMEDRYGKSHWPIIGPIIKANQDHHYRPRDFLKRKFLNRNALVFGLSCAFLACFWALGWLNLFTGSAIVFGALANEFHASAHRAPKENGRLITTLQRTGLMQSFVHHAAHHRKGKDTHYCVMTNHLNPALEAIGFFPTLEAAIRKITGVSPRIDDSVHPRYRKAA